jgi:hypothetical protein
MFFQLTALALMIKGTHVISEMFTRQCKPQEFARSYLKLTLVLYSKA